MSFQDVTHPQLWGILHIPSNKLLRQTSWGYGHTKLDVEGDPNKYCEGAPDTVYAPRLFVDEDTAKRALVQWLRGVHSVETDTEYNEWSGSSYTIAVGVSAEHVSTRHKDEMKVIPIYLHTDAIEYDKK